MCKDLNGSQLSTENEGAVKQIDLFSGQLLYGEPRIDSITSAADALSDEPLLQIYAAIAHLYQQTTQSHQKAITYLERALPLMGKANEREKSLFTAAWSWSSLQMTETLKRFESHCYKWPKDITALKITEHIFYYKGQKYESSRFLRLTTYSYQENKLNPDFLSIHALALSLAAKYEESLISAKQALSINENHPLAQSVLGTYYLNRGMIDQGISSQSYSTWMLALLHLENVDFTDLHRTYEDRYSNAQGVGEQIDAISLLWRLDLEGENNKASWKKLATAIADHANFVVTPVTSALLCYALKKGERHAELKEALSRITHFAQEQTKEDRLIWKEVGIPLIKGCLATAQEDFARALLHLDPIITRVNSGGGSAIQVGLFYEAYVHCLIHSQRYSEAEALIHQRTQGRKMTKRELKWLARCRSLQEAFPV